MFKKLLLFLSILVVIVSMLPIPVSAQDNPWSEVVDANGNILYGNMTDLGEVQEDARLDAEHSLYRWAGDLSPLHDPQRQYCGHAIRHHLIFHGSPPGCIRD